MNRLPALFFAVSLLAFSCNGTTGSNKSDTAATTAPGADTNAPATSDNSQNALDWAGTYTGTTPCANCAGIETSLQLSRNNTYQLTTKYLGKKDTATNETRGSFSWDASGAVITLQGLKDGPTQYKVGEDILIQYDLQGKEITGELADKYILRK